MNESIAPVELVTPSDLKLAEHAEVIRTLGKRAIRDIIEIGKRLTEAKEIAGHGNWLPWLEREFGWSRQTADNFTNVFEASVKMPIVSNLDIPMRGLYLLAAPSTPDEVREAVIDRAERGETLTHADVKKMIADATAKDQEKADKKLKKLEAEYQAENTKLRGELKGAMTLEQIEQTVDEAVAPLLEKIKKYKEKLKAKQEAKTVADPYALESTAITSAMRHLAGTITVITPQQKIEHEALVTKLTGQEMRVGLADDIKHARMIERWVTGFLTEVEHLG